jgi:uncharacterized phage infection (PIP) family protein YhgE
MKTFFEDLGKKIGETAETVTNKAGEAVEVQRLRNQIRALERGNESDYAELGRMIYEHYKDGEVVDAEAIGLCEAIQNRDESITKYVQQISEVKGDIKCDGCGKSVAKDMTYCPSCGTKVPEEKEQEKSDYADDIKDNVVDMAGKVKEKAEHTADEVKEKASDAADIVKEKTTSAAETVKEKTSDAAERVKEKVEDAAETIKEKAKETEEKIRKFTEE